MPASHLLTWAESDARLFLSAAATGSFSGAASLHDISPSAVSKAVSRLETALGVKLFARSTRAIRLTDAGVIFRDRCGPAFQMLAEAAEEASAGASSLRGTVRLGLPSLFGTYLVAPGLASLFDAHPDLKVELVTTMRPSDVVERGLDVAITVGQLPDTALAARPMGYGQFVTVAAPAYVDRWGAPSTPNDLKHHRCLGWLRPDGHIQSWSFRAGPGEHTADLQVQGASDDMHHLAAMAVAGVGICHVPLFAVEKWLKCASLVRLLESFEPAPKLASFVYPSGRPMPRRVRVLIEHLLRAAAVVPGTSRNQS